ncbi:MAG: DUF2806 domain-containing protein [Cetobacterium sp.]|uniref:DUF2806 domain-containing protein n=1 Tax=Cetobacterium sp. TaxID=2071632 RepID=UPI003EE57B31
MEINNLVGLKEPLLKLIEVISNGIGKAYEPTHIKRIAKAKVEEINLIGEAIDRNIALPIKYENGDITVDVQNIQELMIRTQNRVLFQEVKKQQNIESIVEKAYTELKEEKEEKEVSSEEVDQDWIIRFFNSIEDISEEHMQKIWAKILIGEVKQPKSVSKRTLEVLRNLSKEEAQIFEKICKYCIMFYQSLIIVNDKDKLKSNNIAFEEILLLSEIGLIDARDDLNMSFILKKGSNMLIRNNNLLMIGKIEVDEDEIKLDIPVYPLTRVGKELANILKINSDDLNFLEVMKDVKEKNKNIAIGVHKINFMENEIYNYDPNDLLK